MDWKDLAKIIAPLAPKAGAIIGGLIPFPGGALIGEQLGKIVARTFGVPETPEAVAGAVASSSNELALAKINQAIEIARVEIAGFTEVEKAWAKVMEESIIQVNTTMRLELEHQSLFFTGWRPAVGWLFVVFMTVAGASIIIAVALAAGGNDAMIAAIERIQLIAGGYIAALAAMLGVYIAGRSHEKGKAIEAGRLTTVTPALPPPPLKPVQRPPATPPVRMPDRHAPA